MKVDFNRTDFYPDIKKILSFFSGQFMNNNINHVSVIGSVYTLNT